MKIGCIIQARLNSSRFPKKILANVNGKSVLQRVVDQVYRANTINEVIIAHPGKEKLPLITGPKYWGGPENNVLQRYYDAAVHFNLDVIVRVTSDCPLVPPFEIDRCVNTLLDEEADYVTNRPSVPDGWDVEAFRFQALEKAYKEAELPFELEHVTPHIKTDMSLNLVYLEAPKLSIDTENDLERVREYHGLEQ